MTKQRQIFIVTDLGYGDSGKGTMTDYLVRRHGAHTVVRYNGGAQALHRVVDPDGRSHSFSLFGSGTFVPGVRTHLSRHVIIHLHRLLEEEASLRALGIADAFDRLTIDERALIATPIHQAVNCLRELARGDGRHGSCGLGIGETRHDSIRKCEDSVTVSDLGDANTLRRKFRRLRERKRDELQDIITSLDGNERAGIYLKVLTGHQVIENCVDLCLEVADKIIRTDERFECDLFQRTGSIIFEGSQGVLLDQWHGFHPYTTWSITTSQHAHELLHEYGYDGAAVETIGVVRAYATRHGPGPFVTENTGLTETLPDVSNGMNEWQRTFRVGHFDAVATRYAIDVDGHINTIAVTCLDRMTREASHIVQRYAISRLTPYSVRDIMSVCPVSGDIKYLFPKRNLEDQDRQAKLTECLLKYCTPGMYAGVLDGLWMPGSPAVREFIHTLQMELSRHVGYLSFGETAEDKYTIE